MTAIVVLEVMLPKEQRQTDANKNKRAACLSKYWNSGQEKGLVLGYPIEEGKYDDTETMSIRRRMSPVCRF